MGVLYVMKLNSISMPDHATDCLYSVFCIILTSCLGEQCNKINFCKISNVNKRHQYEGYQCVDGTCFIICIYAIIGSIVLSVTKI